MVNEKFVIQLQGKSFVTYEGLLDLAHQRGLESIKVDIVQLPNLDNNYTAICRAEARLGEKTFVDYGDASPSSVKGNLTPHIIRMASTRAKARALRDMTNVGITSIEELDFDNDTHSIPINNDIIEQENHHLQINESPPPTQRQLETLKKLAQDLDVPVELENLNRKQAGDLISSMLDKKYKRH